jgi:glycosyltransferase involved in cell wall biosynthesis
MHVLFLTRYRLDIGGVTEALRGLARRMPDLGVTVSVFCTDPTARTMPFLDETRAVYGAFPKPGLLGRRARAVERLCRERDIDLVHAHTAYRAGWAARSVKRALGTPYVVTSHCDLSPHLTRRLARPAVRRRLRTILADADAVTHLNPMMRDAAADLHPTPAKDFIIPNGIDLSWWRTPAVPTPGRYVLAIGRLVPQKQFDVLVDAMAHPAVQARDVRLVLAGEGPARDALAARARSLGLTVETDLTRLPAAPTGAVFLPGAVFDDAKRDLFAGSSAVLFSSDPGEAFGIVQLEALAAERAVVVGDIPSVRGVISHEKNGLVVPGFAPADWAAAIARLLADDALRTRLQANNRAAAERYDWAAVATQYAQVYQTVLAS